MKIKGNEFMRDVRPRRLNRAEREGIINDIEAAMSRGDDELRVYWTQGTKKIFTAPVRIGDRKLMGGNLDG